MAEPLEKKIAKKKENKRVKKQEKDLNKMSEARWRKLGSIASWVGYRVNIDGEEEFVPVRKKASGIKLINITNNLKKYVAKKKELEAKEQQKKRLRKKSQN